MAEAQSNCKDATLLTDFLQGMEIQVESDLAAMTDLPEVAYDTAPPDQENGPDTFQRYHVGIRNVSDRLKELKKSERSAKKERDLDRFNECRKLRLEYESQRQTEQLRAIVLTLQEKHEGKDMNEVLDLHGLRGKEAKMVIEHQLPLIEARVSSGEIRPNTDLGHVYCIVTGKGSHGTRSVLKPLTERFLLNNGYKYAELKNAAGYKVLFE